MMGYFARDCRRKGKGKGKGGDGSKGYAKGNGKTTKGAEKKGSGKSGGHKGGPSGDLKAGDTRDSAGCAVVSGTGRQNVDGESLTSMMKMQEAAKAEDNLNQNTMRSRRRGECGEDRGGRRRHRPPRGADPSSGHM